MMVGYLSKCVLCDGFDIVKGYTVSNNNKSQLEYWWLKSLDAKDKYYVMNQFSLINQALEIRILMTIGSENIL
jgi:hypothetical protein